jgi:CRP-like cAMP-binding protein
VLRGYAEDEFALSFFGAEHCSMSGTGTGTTKKQLFSTTSVRVWLERHVWVARKASIADDPLITPENCTRTAKVVVEHTEGAHRWYADGEVIMRANDASDSMFLLEQGKVKVTDAAQEEVYAILNIPGTGFGEWGLLTHEKRTATLIADGPCLLRELSREVYNKVSQANPAFAKILERVALGKWNASISKNGTKNESNKSQIIGRNGYKTVIHSLPAYLAEFNNKVVYPKRLKDRSSAGDLQWEVELQKDKLVVVVGEDKMDVQLDTAAVFTPSAVKKKQGQLNNHSSVKWALQDVCAQLRTAILQTIQEGSIKVQTIFAQFDTDGNGVLDQNEVLAGCRYLGIDVTLSEIEAIWPIIDSSGDGWVQCNEFVNFVEKSGRKAHLSAKTFRSHQMSIDFLAHINQQSQRADRIAVHSKKAAELKPVRGFRHTYTAPSAAEREHQHELAAPTFASAS